jgi:hypothetical protein
MEVAEMKKNILIIIGLLITVNYAYTQDLTRLLMNQDIRRYERFRGGVPSLQVEYVTEDRITTVYSTDMRSMRTHVNREYIFGENTIEVNWYLADGFYYSYNKYTFSNGLLISFEYKTTLHFEEDFEQWTSGRTEYFYDSSGNLIRSVFREAGNEIERRYTYLHGNLVLIEEVSRPSGRTRTERVERIDGNIVHTPSYDLFIRTDRKVIENRIDGDTRTTTITYYLDGQVFEIQRYIFINDRIQSVMIDNRWRTDVQEMKFFY